MSHSSPSCPPDSSPGAHQARSDCTARDRPHHSVLLVSPGADSLLTIALCKNLGEADLNRHLHSDRGHAIRLVAVANTSLYGGRGELTDAMGAQTFLSRNGLRNVLLAIAVAELVPAAQGAASLLSICLRRAVVAQHLALLSHSVDAEDAFMGGLFLEVGLLQQACDAFEECVEASRTPARHRPVRERLACLVPHPDLGARIAKELCLPETLAAAIFAHHSATKPGHPFAALCWAAELCAGVLEAGDEAQNLRLAQTAAAQLGVGADDVRAILTKTPPEVQELEHALECPAGVPPSARGLQRPVDKDLLEMHVQYEQLVEAVVSVLDERDRLAFQLNAAKQELHQRDFVRSE